MSKIGRLAATALRAARRATRQTEQRTISIHTTITPSDYAKLQRSLQRLGLSRAELLRFALYKQIAFTNAERGARRTDE